MINNIPVRQILFLAANPKDTLRLRLDKELREIETGLQLARNREHFHLEQKWAVRPIDVRRAILNCEPQIVHFSGHGAGNEGLVFEDDLGNARFVDAQGLAGLFELFADQVECVVLNACYSKIQAEAIAQHINYVIGMSQSIGDKAAIEFAIAFYDALGAGKAVDFAHKYACAAIRLAGISEQLTPVLISRKNLNNALDQQQSAVKNETKSISSHQPIELFFSYAREDEKLRNELVKHLSILQRQGVIQAWYDRQISPGAEWAKEIDQHLNRSRVILLLISADFLASNYCYDIELTRAMERHADGEACVIPVILREVDWKGAPFSKLQALPQDAKPVTKWDDIDAAFTNIAKGIRTVIEELRG